MLVSQLACVIEAVSACTLIPIIFDIMFRAPICALLQVLDSGDVNVGYNAETGVYEDLLKAGIIDPAKVPWTLNLCALNPGHVAASCPHLPVTCKGAAGYESSTPATGACSGFGLSLLTAEVRFSSLENTKACELLPSSGSSNLLASYTSNSSPLSLSASSPQSLLESGEVCARHEEGRWCVPPAWSRVTS